MTWFSAAAAPMPPWFRGALWLGRVPTIMRVGADRQIFVYTRHDLTDDQWANLEPLLPVRTPIRGGRWMDHRKVINGVLWRTRSGSAWRDLPPEYGNWKTVYNGIAAGQGMGPGGKC